MARRVLVTGGAGFIGSRMIERALQRGTPRVICLDNFNDYYDPAIKRENVAGFAGDPRVRMVEQSFNDAAAMQRLFAATLRTSTTSARGSKPR